MSKNIDCIICGSKKIKLAFMSTNKHGRQVLTPKDKFSIYRCSHCASHFLNLKKIDEKFFKKYYEEDYYSNGKNNKIIDFATKLLFNYSVKIKNFLILSEFRDKNELLYLLDVGCGDGKFLSNFKKDKFTSFGIEINPIGVLESLKKNLNVNKTDLLKFKTDLKFDIITFWHVIEHLQNPKENLIKAKKLLKKDGIVVISTPNTKSLGFLLSNKNWFHLDSPRHLILYNVKTMKFLADKTGFKIKKIYHEWYDFPLDLFWSLSSNPKNYIFLLAYPFIKFFSKETLTYILIKK